MDLSDLRRNYTQDGLLEERADADPLVLFGQWFEQAAQANAGQWYEPNATTLATVTPEGRPSARVVLLKEFSRDGFVFFTNYDSSKARDLSAHPLACLVFHWPWLERQVRVTGAVSRVDRRDTEQYFARRPRGNQLGAWVSRQSQPVPDRAHLEAELARLEKEFEGRDIPPPPNWGGYRVTPDSIEFWQGRPNRLHDRLLYLLDGGIWRRQRLAP